MFYILKKGTAKHKGKVRHIVEQGDEYTLCGKNIRKGERGRDLVWFQQSSCPNCREAYLSAYLSVAITNDICYAGHAIFKKEIKNE